MRLRQTSALDAIPSAQEMNIEALPASSKFSRTRVDFRTVIFVIAISVVVLIQCALFYYIASEKSCGTSISATNAIQTAAIGRLMRWEYWPYDVDIADADRARIGIVTGGSSDLYGGTEGAYGDATACLLRLLAERHGYALYVERALQRFGSDRPVAWLKIRLLLDRLDDVDLIVWVDADLAWTDHDTNFQDLFFHRLSTKAACTENLGQPRWDVDAGIQAENSSSALFFWVSADVRPKPKGNMNINSAVIALRGQSEESRTFLTRVWARGNDPMSFTKHNKGWRKLPPGNHYWGWPFEQGAVWEVLDEDRSLLQRTCVTSVGALHSVQYHRWLPNRTPGAHMPGMSPTDRRKAGCKHLSDEISSDLERCSQALRLCPDLYAGRVIVAHAEGLCGHCLGKQNLAPPKRPDGIEAPSDWSAFDCTCLQPPAL